MVNSPLIRLAISWGGGIGGVPLDCHEEEGLFGGYGLDLPPGPHDAIVTIQDDGFHF